MYMATTKASFLAPTLGKCRGDFVVKEKQETLFHFRKFLDSSAFLKAVADLPRD